jgi:hypothetical protein
MYFGRECVKIGMTIGVLACWCDVLLMWCVDVLCWRIDVLIFWWKKDENFGNFEHANFVGSHAEFRAFSSRRYWKLLHRPLTPPSLLECVDNWHSITLCVRENTTTWHCDWLNSFPMKIKWHFERSIYLLPDKHIFENKGRCGCSSPLETALSTDQFMEAIFPSKRSFTLRPYLCTIREVVVKSYPKNPFLQASLKTLQYKRVQMNEG